MIFWAAFSMLSGFSNQPVIGKYYSQINEKAAAAGLRPLEPRMTQDDLGMVLHLESARQKYPWLADVMEKGDQYLALAGLLAGGETPGSGGASGVPALLQGCISPESAYVVEEGTMVMAFDPSGADRDFIRSVPLKFWNGSEYAAEIPAGWSYEKTDTSIVFHCEDGTAPRLQIQFDTEGTGYGLGGGSGYTSAQEFYEDHLELWLCVQCAGTHKNVAGGEAPLEAHQRCVYLEIPDQVLQADYYASIGPRQEEEEKGSIQFTLYRHEEDFRSDYNLQMYKYDFETGQPLEGATFKLYERFDDSGQIDREADGPVHLYRRRTL